MQGITPLPGPLDDVIAWRDGRIVALDQTRLPHEVRVLDITTVDELVTAIVRLAVRGAPVLGVAGALGVALAVRQAEREGWDAQRLAAEVKRIGDARPTAVNLRREVTATAATIPLGPEAVEAAANEILDNTVAVSKRVSERGARYLMQERRDVRLKILTHCNTGTLACLGWGTALGVVRALRDHGALAHVIADETRPLLQGARLTCWELGQLGIEHYLAPDGAAPFLIGQAMADAVVVGADRVAANGDVANKIGTYSLALAARRAGIPFVVAAPESTIDETTPDGGQIPLEQRPADEVTHVLGVPAAPAGTRALNYAFDVTPADLVTAIVTEDRLIFPGQARSGSLPLCRRPANATLMRVAPRNRNSGKRKTQRRGLSGNPQRRAEQLGKDGPPRPARQERQERQGLDDLLPRPRPDLFKDIRHALAGGAEEAPWWRDSHERVLRQARASGWPPERRGIEERTCELVGGQFYDNLQAHAEGHHQAQWLRALVERAGAALGEAIAEGGDWQPLWTLLYGVTLTTPEPAAEDERESARREEFPDIKDPHATAAAELAKASILLSERSVAAPSRFPDPGARPAGIPLVARDAYGSRFLVVTPFGYEAGAPDHWYAWDVDTCWVVSVAGAGTFASADDALDEWRGAVGTAADAGLSPGDPGLVASLLDPCLQTGVLSDMLRGDEPRELIRELYRMRRRARVLAGTEFLAADRAPAGGDTDGDTGGSVDRFGRPADAHRAFRAWYRARHPDAPKGIAGTAETIIGEWGSGRPLDERSFYACSPFRVAMTAHLIGNEHEPAYADRAIRLLPEWTQWCAQQSGIPDHLAAPSIAAARAAADALDKQDAGELPDPTDTTPFRHAECP